MKKVKQQEILNILKPYSMEVITPGEGCKVIKIDEFLSACILKYKHQLRAVNISYNVEYSKQNESEV
ncbi:MAG: hypothetical protein IJ681_00630 [Bacteroidales bacterium]|nr:hypothetical protein [Bacteroidales bacterium]